jgi:hypothetical protein
MILLVHVLCHLSCIKGKSRDLLEGLGLGGWIILKWIQPAIQLVPGTLTLGIKRPGREADHSPPFSAEVKECMELYFRSPICLHGMMLS